MNRPTKPTWYVPSDGQPADTSDLRAEFHKARMAEFFQKCARDDRLSDTQLRAIVRSASLQPPSDADIANANEHADKHGLERVGPYPPELRKA